MLDSNIVFTMFHLIQIVSRRRTENHNRNSNVSPFSSRREFSVKLHCYFKMKGVKKFLVCLDLSDAESI